MRLLQRFAQGELRLTRIEAFSGGVFAIVVTLLVLDLKVPSLQVSYLIGAAAAWFSVHAAFVGYLLTPLFFIVPPTQRGVAASARGREAH